MNETGMKTITVRRISDDTPIAELYINETAEIKVASNELYIQMSVGDAPTFDLAKKQAIDAVNAYAGRRRGEFMSSGLGIELIYVHKELEAKAYSTAGYPAITDGSTYPFIWEEATALGLTPTQVCDRILARINALSVIGSQLEGVRMYGMAGIDAATDMQSLAAAKLVALNALQGFTA